MIFRQLGKDVLNGSILQMGTFAAASARTDDPSDKGFIEAVHSAIENGVNVFDTAEIYGNGRSEQVLGEALKGHREKVLIAGKAYLPNLTWDGLRVSCEGSLKRLHTDYLDIFYIHIPNPEIPLEETMEGLQRLKREGKIKSIGVSNFTLDELKAACKLGQVDIVQNCYSLLWRWMEADIIPFCAENHITFAAYSPLVQGLLSGKFTHDLDLDKLDDRKRITLFRKDWFGKCLAVAEGLRYVAGKYGKTPSQAAINWILSQNEIGSVVFGAKNRAQLAEIIGAIGWQFEKADLTYMDRLSRTITDDLPRNISIWW